MKKLHKIIQDSLDKKQKNPAAPNNLFELKLEDLLKIGYKKLGPGAYFKSGDILAATTKNQDMWIILNNIKNPPGNYGKTVDNLIILRKK